MDKGTLKMLVLLVLVAFAGISGCMAIAPQYEVYSQRMKGRAELQRAESNRQIRVLEAQAAYDAADLTAKAETRRAEGVAEANRIIADSLGGAKVICVGAISRCWKTPAKAGGT